MYLYDAHLTPFPFSHMAINITRLCVCMCVLLTPSPSCIIRCNWQNINGRQFYYNYIPSRKIFIGGMGLKKLEPIKAFSVCVLKICVDSTVWGNMCLFYIQMPPPCRRANSKINLNYLDGQIAFAFLRFFMHKFVYIFYTRACLPL